MDIFGINPKLYRDRKKSTYYILEKRVKREESTRRLENNRNMVETNGIEKNKSEGNENKNSKRKTGRKSPSKKWVVQKLKYKFKKKGN